jgi:hypothetical protein
VLFYLTSYAGNFLNQVFLKRVSLYISNSTNQFHSVAVSKNSMEKPLKGFIFQKILTN